MTVVVRSKMKLSIIIATALVALLGGILLLGQQAGAYSAFERGGDCNWYYRSFFWNSCVDYATSMKDVIPGGVPSNAQGSKQALVQWLKSENNIWGHGSDHRRTGAGFIVYTMLGKYAPMQDRNISAADWAELEKRLYSPEITMGLEDVAMNAVNTGYHERDNDEYWDDVVPYDSYVSGRAVILRHNGRTVYILRIDCANPLVDKGDPRVPGLPSYTVNYSLNPTIKTGMDSIDDSTTEIPGVGMGVENPGPTASYDKIYTAVSRFVVPRGNDIPSSGGTTGVPNDWWYNGSNWSCYVPHTFNSSYKCKQLYADNDGFTYPAGYGSSWFIDWPNPTATGVDDISDLNLGVGDSVCYVSMVSRYNQNAAINSVRYSKPICLTVSKKPRAQFWGSDIRSGEQVITSTSSRLVDGKKVYYGSWAEYGILAQGNVNSSSGAGLSAGVAGREVANAMLYNKLTFANTAEPYGNFGNISASVLPPGFLSSSSSIGVNSIDPNSLGSGTYRRNGDLIINGAELPPGKQIIINATGTVTIEGSISYANGDYGNVASLPQLVILAQNIVIASGVDRVDAWLMTHRPPAGDTKNGYISTCDKPGNDGWLTNLDYVACNKQIHLNGPIITDHLYLRRTYGAERDNPGAPAEIINLRPDAYLWAYGYSIGSGSIKTTYIKELPPRF